MTPDIELPGNAARLRVGPQHSRVGLGRLTGETRTGTNAFTASYALDGVGNRTSQTVGGSTTSFTLNADDELTATSGGFTNSYSYNANGEQTGRTLGGTAYSLSYDYEGQLTQITQGQTSTDFAYDALGRRFSRTAGGTTTEFVYGAGGMVLEKQGGSYTQAYSQGNGLLRRGSEYPLYDGHGSERTVTNSSQTVTGSVNFEAFGQVAGTTGSSTNPYMYAGDWGYRNDGDAGLMHVGARYSDAQVGGSSLATPCSASTRTSTASMSPPTSPMTTDSPRRRFRRAVAAG